MSDAVFASRKTYSATGQPAGAINLISGKALRESRTRSYVSKGLRERIWRQLNGVHPWLLQSVRDSPMILDQCRFPLTVLANVVQLMNSTERNAVIPTAVGTDPKKKAEWLSSRILDSIKYVANKRLAFQRRASAVRIATIGLSALVSVSLGVTIPQYTEELRMFAFILSSAVIFLNGLEPFFNYRALWVEHEEAKYLLHKLNDKMQYLLAGDEELSQGVLDSLMAEHQAVWDRLSGSWLQHRRLPRESP